MGVDLEAGWLEFAAALAVELEPAGIPVTTDPQELNPPCVLVVPTVAAWPMLAGHDRVGRLTLAVYLLAPPPGDRDAIGYMLRHASTVAAAIGVKEMSATTYGGAQLPGYAATITATITEPEPPLEEEP